MFCLYEPVQNAIADSLATIETQKGYKGFPNYYLWLSQQFETNRNHFVKAFQSCSLDVKVFVPAGGYFMLIDVSKVKVDDKYYSEGQSHDEAVS